MSDLQDALDQIMHRKRKAEEARFSIFCNESRRDIPRLVSAIEAVLDLHRPVEVEPSMTICDECSNAIGVGDRLRYMPVEEWPCPTVRALTSKLTGEDDD